MRGDYLPTVDLTKYRRQRSEVYPDKSHRRKIYRKQEGISKKPNLKFWWT